MVTKDVPPYAVVVGVPARVIAFRCAENLIEELLYSSIWILRNFKYLELLAFIESELYRQRTVDSTGGIDWRCFDIISATSQIVS